jgi:hypothetical protein
MARRGRARHGSAWHGKDQGKKVSKQKPKTPLQKGQRERQMKQYRITLEGLTPLLMHNDNLNFSEKVMAWRRDPQNKEHSVSGDDRTPPWTWIGYLYHDGKNIGISSDNIMTMLREGGAKVLTGKGKETYKKQSQSGIMLDQQQFDLFCNNQKIGIEKVKDLIGNLEFNDHIELAESLDFELLVKRAKIGRSKHIRVRPMFRQWVATGTLTVLDEELTGLTEQILTTILKQAGSLCGLCDWRPSSPSSGTFGKFAPEVERI